MNKRYWIYPVLLCLLLGWPVFAEEEAPDDEQIAVGTVNLTTESAGRTIDVAVWYPAQATNDTPTTYRDGIIALPSQTVLDNPPADDRAVPYPLVIFSHGSGGFRYQSLWLVEYLAAQGYVVMAANHVGNTITDAVLRQEAFAADIGRGYGYRPLDILAQIALAESLNESDDILRGLIDTDSIAIIGHSFGGYTAIAAAGGRLNFDELSDHCATAQENDNTCFLLDQRDGIAEFFGIAPDTSGAWPPLSDERIQAVVALSPWNAPIFDSATLAELDIPHLIMVGTADTITPTERDASAFFDALTDAPRAIAEFEDGGHYIFVDECFELAIQSGFTEQCSDPVWDMTTVHQISQQIITAFLRSALDGDGLNAVRGDFEFDGVNYRSAAPVISAERLVPQVIAQYPHDTRAFTQGLLLHNGVFYESTGNYGQSTLRRVAIETGEILQKIALESRYFGEGLALIPENDRLIQLTWRENVAFVYDRETFDLLDTFSYDGEGWGLCYDGQHLYMSNGSDRLYQRDPHTFEVLRMITVTQEGEGRNRLNELACVGDSVYANVWMSDEIVRIRKADGIISAVIDASGLLMPEERANANVLNGITYDEAQSLFYVTGKYWPYMFLVDFMP
ncbi:MAG: alpha/beta fold hydrolase [Anaerolineaceae bacterium]|nr:MAG: alpha/beta fold hydrolase [Anaerolineaceae bacterium]